MPLLQWVFSHELHAGGTGSLGNVRTGVLLTLLSLACYDVNVSLSMWELHRRINVRCKVMDGWMLYSGLSIYIVSDGSLKIEVLLPLPEFM